MSPNDSYKVSTAALNYTPNKLDLSNWSSGGGDGGSRSPQPNVVSFAMSKDGVESLKARLYDSSNSSISPIPFSPPQYHYHQQAQQQQHQQPKQRVKLSSHQNYLFNSKNAVNALKNSTNQYYNNNNNNNNNRSDYYNNYADNIAASDL